MTDYETNVFRADDFLAPLGERGVVGELRRKAEIEAGIGRRS